MNWFIFSPENGSAQDPMDPTQYRIFEECKIFSANVQRGKVYAIRSSQKNGLPRITKKLAAEMSAAMHLMKDTENVLLKR